MALNSKYKTKTTSRENLQRSARKTIILSLMNPAIHHPLKYSQNISVRKSRILNTFNFIILIKCVSNKKCVIVHISKWFVSILYVIVSFLKIFCVFDVSTRSTARCEIFFLDKKIRELTVKKNCALRKIRFLFSPLKDAHSALVYPPVQRLRAPASKSARESSIYRNFRAILC